MTDAYSSAKRDAVRRHSDFITHLRSLGNFVSQREIVAFAMVSAKAKSSSTVISTCRESRYLFSPASSIGGVFGFPSLGNMSILQASLSADINRAIVSLSEASQTFSQCCASSKSSDARWVASFQEHDVIVRRCVGLIKTDTSREDWVCGAVYDCLDAVTEIRIVLSSTSRQPNQAAQRILNVHISDRLLLSEAIDLLADALETLWSHRHVDTIPT